MNSPVRVATIETPNGLQLARHSQKLQTLRDAKLPSFAGRKVSVIELWSAEALIAGTIITDHSLTLSIDVFWVDSQFRTQGLGRVLFSEIESFARGRGLELLTGTSFEPDRNLDFWKTLGCETFAVLEDLGPGRRIFFLKRRVGAQIR